MGSKNTDGSDINQGRKTVRKLGGAVSHSADRSETSIQLDGEVELGTEANSVTVAYSTTSQGEAVKVSDEGGLVERITDGEVVSLAQSHINPFANGGGGGAGADTLGGLVYNDGAFAVGNGSGWVAESGQDARASLGLGSGDSPTFTAIQIGEATTNGVKLEVTSGYLYVREGDDSAAGAGIIVNSIGSENNQMNLGLGGLALSRFLGIQWENSDNIYTGAADIGLYRGSAGVLHVSSGASLVNLGALKSLRHVEIITPAPSITLAAASGQVVIVRGSAWRQVNLPSAPVLGLHYDIKDGDGTASSGNIILNGNGKNLDGSASGVLNTNYESRTVVYNGSEWNNI